jgi:hypothetical protein
VVGEELDRGGEDQGRDQGVDLGRQDQAAREVSALAPAWSVMAITGPPRAPTSWMLEAVFSNSSS